MDFKVYNKRGAANYKERNLLKQLEPALEKLASEDPNFVSSFKTATSYEELQALHAKYCITDAEIISEIKNDAPANNKNETTSDSDSSIKFDNPEEPLEDPMNRANPKIRDYVLNDSFSPEANKNPEAGGTPNLEEPTSYEDAFKLPDDELDPKELKEKQRAEANQNKTNASNNNGGGNAGPKTNGAVNPAFDEMSQQRKNKQTKRFAKYIVEFFAMALETGYVWFITKDINDLKLAEYELKDKIDPDHLELVMQLTEEQEVTIRQFFQLQCSNAVANSKISKDEREELTEVLADVLMEKGFAPTPMQSLLMVAGQIVVSKGLTAFVAVQQNNSILNQLFAMRADTKAEQGEPTRPIKQTPPSDPVEDSQEDAQGKNEYHENAHKDPNESSTELTVQ